MKRPSRGGVFPPLLENVKKAVIHGEDKKISIYVGLNDEGLAVPGGSFIRDGDEEVLKRLEEFNLTQNYKILK